MSYLENLINNNIVPFWALIVVLVLSNCFFLYRQYWHRFIVGTFITNSRILFSKEPALRESPVFLKRLEASTNSTFCQKTTAFSLSYKCHSPHGGIQGWRGTRYSSQNQFQWLQGRYFWNHPGCQAVNSGIQLAQWGLLSRLDRKTNRE